ncbi:hypothetical protein P8C59_006462 [Phyllachora maydis]|uniref:Uncharacterized protein n=1 Tax=Phyllachora maydis TaxID=1825666 RepID=A0AAD9I6T2_9PEZI|nr:hypothetical protein P8C59_006462 [Phyllachora maydis]
MYIYIACSPYCCCYYDSSFTNLLIADIDSFSDLDNLVYTILGISTIPLALAPIPAKPAKIMPAIRYTAAYKANNAGRYTTNSGLTANKDDNDAYNRAYIPPANIEEEKGSSSDNNSVNSSTSDSANKGKDSGVYECNKGTLCYKDILPCK